MQRKRAMGRCFHSKNSHDLRSPLRRKVNYFVFITFIEDRQWNTCNRDLFAPTHWYHTHTHKQDKNNNKNAASPGRLQATRATGVPFTRVPAKEARQTAKRTANIGRTKSVKKGTEKKQKSGRKGRPRALRSLASAALRKKEKRERRTSQASAAEQTKLNKRSSRLIRPAWLAERSSPTRFRPKDDPRATKKKNRQNKARERPQEVLPFSRQGGDASLLPLF